MDSCVKCRLPRYRILRLKGSIPREPAAQRLLVHTRLVCRGSTVSGASTLIRRTRATLLTPVVSPSITVDDASHELGVCSDACTEARVRAAGGASDGHHRYPFRCICFVGEPLASEYSVTKAHEH
jgi:hypothetical protein